MKAETHLSFDQTSLADRQSRKMVRTWFIDEVRMAKHESIRFGTIMSKQKGLAFSTIMNSLTLQSKFMSQLRKNCSMQRREDLDEGHEFYGKWRERTGRSFQREGTAPYTC